MLLLSKVAILSVLASFITITVVVGHFATIPTTAEALEDKDWIASSKSWADRTACRWLGICGLSHALHPSAWDFDYPVPRSVGSGEKRPNSTSFWESGPDDFDSWDERELKLREVPEYVLKHAPYVHLFSQEEFWPGDIAEHLIHTTPFLNYTPIFNPWRHPNLSNLGELNRFGKNVFLTSNDNVEQRPDWLGGEKNIPDLPPGEADPRKRPDYVPARHGRWSWRPETDPPDKDDPEFDEWWYAPEDGLSLDDDKMGNGNKTAVVKGQVKPKPKTDLRRRSEETAKKESAGGRSDAPVTLIVVDKGGGVVDAFWFYFYSYNLGNKVFNVRFGNHVGDWEHTVIRFYKGKPKAVFFSEHDDGEAYSWEAVEKIGERPVSYSATGTHAMYATPGIHTYVLPFGLLHDATDRGPLWDPALNLRSYTYNATSDKLRASTANPRAPTSWFYFWGHWGDKFYALNDARQYRFAGQYHYVNGPLGPRFKRLGRKKVCQGRDEDHCRLKHWGRDGKGKRPQKKTPGGA
ncbi:hypothetical protein EJ06DRAFT_536755 [Trichodelitschia bisporula]|uniref:Vacuolar protein sorting-associated protein 62 n=1 Tax=Trichodelitschia bisporula TaxID=703511 RepID=A0A6G1I1R5_9PEZI|nr:hypothetical protein EJ06DRAFT_536755 [Trichodelitschia bisporula]